MPPSDKLEKLRSYRVRPDRVSGIGDTVSLLKKNVERTGKRLHEFITLWETLIPAKIVQQTRVRGIRGGVAYVSVSSSSVVYEVDRILRDGIEAELRSRYSTTLVRVKVSIGSLEDPKITRE